MILDDILAVKRKEVEARERQVPVSQLRKVIRNRGPALDFASALRAPGVSIIAEVKRASPSKGVICADLDAAKTACQFAGAGAAAVSVLTDQTFFLGTLPDLQQAKAALTENGYLIPVLQKDFVVSPYQVQEARALGADALLLIVAALSETELGDLLALAREIGLTCLVEVHNEKELAPAVACGARVIGINNRDLGTFEVDLGTTQRLAPLIPHGRLVVSESGISSLEDISFLTGCGVDAVLVGETLARAADPAGRVRELIRP